MRFGFDEVHENPERSLFDQNGNFLRKEMSPSERRSYTDSLVKRVRNLTEEEVDAMAFATAKALGVKDPEIDPEVVRKIHTEGIHVG